MPNFILQFFLIVGIISNGISFNLVKTINIVPKLNEINYIPDPTQISSSLDNISIVRGIANFLPNIDLIGHQVLLSNKELIPIILEKDNIPDDIKKELILGIIKMTQYGDSFGGILLENYYHIVDKIF